MIFVYLSCDVCGAEIEAPSENEAYTRAENQGWILDDKNFGDTCRKCQQIGEQDDA